MKPSCFPCLCVHRCTKCHEFFPTFFELSKKVSSQFMRGCHHNRKNASSALCAHSLSLISPKPPPPPVSHTATPGQQINHSVSNFSVLATILQTHTITPDTAWHNVSTGFCPHQYVVVQYVHPTINQSVSTCVLKTSWKASIVFHPPFQTICPQHQCCCLLVGSPMQYPAVRYAVAQVDYMKERAKVSTRRPATSSPVFAQIGRYEQCLASPLLGAAGAVSSYFSVCFCISEQGGTMCFTTHPCHPQLPRRPCCDLPCSRPCLLVPVSLPCLAHAGHTLQSHLLLLQEWTQDR